MIRKSLNTIVQYVYRSLEPVVKLSKNVCLRRIACWLFIWLLVLTTPAIAQPSSSPAPTDMLRQMQEQIDEERSKVSEERDRISDIEQSAQERLRGIQLNIQSTDIAYKDYEFQIQLANKRLKELQVDL
ncbi:MAG: hypothetical protein LDL41_23090, partial [Coleofasciculus sp. S288]|nr:hypothetical protein [Coleofasciculus sp. S288]